MPLPLVGGTIWTEMGPQEEARVMKTYHVERTKNWTSLHSNWLMYISHCYKQLGTTAPGRNQQLGQRNDLASECAECEGFQDYMSPPGFLGRKSSHKWALV
ncbi:dexamethasone-induced protein isoform X4 [Meriones unguiculatus]|uniref:dexamethasone-induced protein isoform X4 n=1 Tax=Meriones unguiculatus TaxID=10047 RepID=UPI00293E783F|nr:dexamethasone-induced protein isoform X4 [Meriones unguiculatus]